MITRAFRDLLDETVQPDEEAATAAKSAFEDVNRPAAKLDEHPNQRHVTVLGQGALVAPDSRGTDLSSRTTS